MKGHVPIDLPTKKYIKAFLIAELGEKPVLSKEHMIGSKLYDILQHSTNERKAKYSNSHYNATIRVYISKHTFRSRGANLNETNLKNFNGFIQAVIKEKMRFLLDLFVPADNSFEKAREVMKIDEEDWDNDSIQKDYYWYRVKQRPLLYKKEPREPVPAMSFYGPPG